MNKKVDKRKIWLHYHSAITCTQFKDSWESFLQQSIKVSYSPIFCQYITQKVHDKLIYKHLPTAQTSEVQINEITPTELNALRYASGLICNSSYDMKQKVLKYPNSDELL